MAKLVAFANRKGGSGKTSLAVNVAAALARRGAVVLIDADPQGSASSWLADSGEVPVTHAGNLSALGRALALVEREPGLAIVDCPPLDASITAAAIREAALVVVPASPSPLDLWAARPLLEGLAEKGTPALVVLNKVRAGAVATRTAREAFEELGARVAKAEIGFRVAFVEAVAGKRSVLAYAKKSLAAEEIRSLAREVSRLLEG